MTTDLWMALAAVGWTWILIMVAATPRLLKSPRWALSARDQELRIDSLPLGRAERAAENMKENLPLFLGAVLIVHVAGAANGTSALGAQIFMLGRLVHYGVYLAGIPMIRTLSWAVSMAGIALVAAPLLS